MWLLDLLFPPREDERVLREVSLDAFLALTDPTLVALGGMNATALLPFTNNRVRAAIHEAKYHGSEKAFSFLTGVLVDYLREEDLRNARLVPVPLGRLRRSERGYNQVEEVARRASKTLEIPVSDEILIRVRETLSQVSLPREKRLENMRGAFTAGHSADPTHTYIVLDDVSTTGATLQAAVAALTEAGARKIMAVALAH